MLTVFIRFGSGEVVTDGDPDVLRKALRDPEARFWVDLDRPNEDELALLDDVFGFHPLAIEDTINYQQRPKIESYNHFGGQHDSGYFYMVIHGPDRQTFTERVRTKELDIFVSERYLITVHDEPMSSIEQYMRRVRADPGRMLEGGIDMMLHGILDLLVDHYSPILDHLQEKIEDLEDAAMDAPGPEVLKKIGFLKRDLMNLRRIIGPQRDVIAQLTRGEVPFIREAARVYLRDVQDHLIRAVELIEIYRELIASARDLYLSSMNNQLNNVMKTLTLITVIALPINMVTGFFGMNFDHLPIHNFYVFWLTLSIMLMAVAGVIYVARKKRWL